MTRVPGDDAIDICSALDLLNASEEQPSVVLKVNGKNVQFLRDSDCKTVPGVQTSNGILWVKAVNGASDRKRLSKPVFITDPVSGVHTRTPVVISEDCPVNLLGRDVMTILAVGVIPTKNGMRAIRIDRDPGDVYHLEVPNNSLFLP